MAASLRDGCVLVRFGAVLPELNPVTDDEGVDAVQAEADFRIAERCMAEEASR